MQVSFSRQCPWIFHGLFYLTEENEALIGQNGNEEGLLQDKNCDLGQAVVVALSCSLECRHSMLEWLVQVSVLVSLIQLPANNVHPEKWQMS